MVSSTANIILEKEAKLTSLSSASLDAREEHILQMEILNIQKNEEEEKLKQEKMKTALLKLQFELETGVEWKFSDKNIYIKPW